jgi:hypothetical protein
LHVLARGDKKLFLLLHESTKQSIRIRIHTRLPAEQQNQASKTKRHASSCYHCPFLNQIGLRDHVVSSKAHEDFDFLLHAHGDCTSKLQGLCLPYTGWCVYMSTCLPVASAIHHLLRAPRLLVTRSHELYVNLAARREYLSPGHSGSTSTTPRVWVPRFVAWLTVDYFAYAVCPGASAHRAAHRRLLSLRGASGCFGTSRGS